MKSIYNVAVALIGMLALTSMRAGAAATPIDQHVPADPRGTVEIINTAGSIHCTGWDKPEIQITGELSRGAERLDVQQQGKTVTIRVIMRTGSFNGGNTLLEVKLPAASALRVSAVSADVEVRGITGEQRLQSISGDMLSEAAGADLTLKTISGDLKLRGKNAPVRVTVSTVSGNASVLNVAGELDLDTVSGDVEIDMSSISRARMKTISGDLVMSGRLLADARIDVSSVSGDLRFRWPGAEAANVDVESFSGDISSCFGSVAVQRPKYGPGSSWRYVAAGASSDVHVKSMSGDVAVCNR